MTRKPGFGLTLPQLAALLAFGVAAWFYFIPFVVLIWQATISFTR